MRMRAEVYHIFNKFKTMLVLVLEDGDTSQQRNQIFDQQQVKEDRHTIHSLLDSHTSTVVLSLMRIFNFGSRA